MYTSNYYKNTWNGKEQETLIVVLYAGIVDDCFYNLKKKKISLFPLKILD